MKELTVLNDFVAVELDPRQEDKGGILIPEANRKAAVWGTVHAVGEKTKNLDVCDRVYVPPTSGTHFIRDGREIVILREGQILVKEER